MDSRLVLTDKQKSLVNQLSLLIDELTKENVGIVANLGENYSFDGFLFYNKSEVLSTDTFEYDSYSTEDIEDYSEEINYDIVDEAKTWYTPNPEEMESLGIKTTLATYQNEWFSVLLQRNEETDIFFRKKEKELKLAKLRDKRKDLETDIAFIKDQLSQIEDNFHILKERHETQSSFDRERKKWESINSDIEQLYEEMDALNCEIKKVESIKIE